MAATPKALRSKQLFLNQALLLFQSQGYDSVTMRDLATACDSSLGAFYYHFKSKEEIVLELFRSSLEGHVRRTTDYLDSHKPTLEEAMTWICRDRFAEFEPYRALLRVLAQKLDPYDPVSPWNPASRPIREQSVALFQQVVSRCMPKVDAKPRRQLARALWLHHLALLAAWSFDRSEDSKESAVTLDQSKRIWKSLPALTRIPGMKSIMSLVLAPLERVERGYA